MNGRIHQFAVSVTAALLLAGCAESAHQTGLAQLGQFVSEDVRSLVDESVSFTTVKASPGSYSGKTVMFGGEVIRAKRSKERTEIEILQLPLGTDGIPSDDRSRSQGRFLAREESFLDPATLPAGTPVTVVGTVAGEATRPLSEGEDDYTFPVLQVVQLLNWPTLPQTNAVGGWPYSYNPYAYYGPSYWGPAFYAYPFWSPWGYAGRGYWFPPPAASSPSSRTPSGSAPPQFGPSGSGSGPRSVPPQFQKRLHN